jgi:hypothetical protein
MEVLVGGAQLREVGGGAGEVADRLQQPRRPAGQLAPDRLGRRHRVVEVAQEPAGPVQQGVSGQGELDPVGGAAQQVAPDQALQGPDLAAQRRLGQVQPRRRPPEVELDGDERPQVAQLDRVRRLGQRQDLAVPVPPIPVVVHGDQYAHPL